MDPTPKQEPDPVKIIHVPTQICPWQCGVQISARDVEFKMVPESGYSAHNRYHNGPWCNRNIRIYMNVHGELGAWERDLWRK